MSINNNNWHTIGVMLIEMVWYTYVLIKKPIWCAVYNNEYMMSYEWGFKSSNVFQGEYNFILKQKYA